MWFSLRVLILIKVLKSYGCLANDMEGKVVGGDKANIRNYPHAVFLNCECDGAWICGSSVLNQRLLVSAAHCVEGCERDFKIFAYAGDEMLDNVRTVIRSLRYLMHEKYDTRKVDNDISLIYLTGDLPLGSNVRRVILQPSFPVDVRGYVAGWGAINDRGDDSVVLKSVDQNVQPDYECNTVVNLKPGMMCALSSHTGEHPAEGDSGSGLVTRNYQILGLVSYRNRNYRDVIVYTNVSYFYNWITTNSRALACHKG